MNSPLPGLLIAANASHAGKTSTALALIAALNRRGYRIQPAKAGPDFIDASYLAALAKRPCLNLDPWMLGKRGLERLLSRLHNEPIADILLIEGAMGLYDGGKGSSLELAKSLNLPILLLLNVAGMGESAAALAEGFLAQARDSAVIAGLVLTHTGSATHATLLARSLRKVLGAYHVPLLGCLPRTGAPKIGSRHLGLVDIAESLPELDSNKLADWLETHVAVHRLLKTFRLTPPKETEKSESAVFFSARKPSKGKARIAIARDRAFSFCYADLPAFFVEQGYTPVFFSPLSDHSLPVCDAIYLPGGYPELFAQRLADNDAMLTALKVAHADHVPIYGECGGYLYLMQELTLQDGSAFPMAGLLPEKACVTHQLQGLGYRKAVLVWDFLHHTQVVSVRGHEFHYAHVTSHSAAPLWRLRDRHHNELGPAGCTRQATAGSFLHLPVEGGRSFWLAWLARISQRHNQG